jgi:uncharacterized Zn-binding protein involved in type VI secretion
VNFAAGTKYVSCQAMTEGTVVVRQPGGTAGTDEIQLSHDGTDGHIANPEGDLFIAQRANGAGHIWLTRIGYANGSNGLRFDPVSDGTNETISAYFGGSLCNLVFRGAAIKLNNGTYQAELVPLATNVLCVGASGDGWFQNAGGVAILNANFTSVSITPANTNLSRTVLAGRSYGFRLLLPVNNATAGDGFRLDFNGGTASMTTFLACAKSAGTITESVVTSAALDTDFVFTSATSTCFVIIEGSMKVNTGGTFIVRAGKSTDAAGATMTLLAGARLEINDLVAV